MSVESIQHKQNQIIDEFNFFEDWSEKYQYLIDLGKSLPEFDQSNKIDSNLIKGCQSKVWLNSSFSDNMVIFEADSDAIISKGIISILIRVFSGHNPKEILDANIDFIEKIGLNSHLSQTRANGLLSMIKQIKIYALAYQVKK
ncbi:MAG: SufE family protein [Candidatus Pelagibacter sp. TMED253]|nr:MAG: SufE family protein [Candidatus Pelagibacter sp. TMED253]